ncbi:MAG: hypothetical protein AAFY57_13055 [Cyanobacteria bacterium J06642_2]
MSSCKYVTGRAIAPKPPLILEQDRTHLVVLCAKGSCTHFYYDLGNRERVSGESTPPDL